MDRDTKGKFVVFPRYTGTNHRENNIREEKFLTFRIDHNSNKINSFMPKMIESVQLKLDRLQKYVDWGLQRSADNIAVWP